MGSTFDNSALVAAAEEFLAAAKSFNGEDGRRVDLMKQAYALRYHVEDARGMLFRHWEAVSECNLWLDCREAEMYRHIR